MHDSLGDRMKNNYESRSKHLLGRRAYTIIRLDGKAFHTYTRGLQRPFDAGLMSDMDEAAAYVCKDVQGAKFAYVQSDEISILLTDFECIDSQAWFDLDVQKICSVSASLATAKFNDLRRVRDGVFEHCENPKLAHFDSRVFQLPTQTEVMNYFIWRQNDAVRNSIASVAQSLYSAKELHGVGSNQQQELIHQKGLNWNDYSSGEKRGRFIEREVYDKDGAIRSRWVTVECPTFTQDNEFILSRIPKND